MDITKLIEPLLQAVKEQLARQAQALSARIDELAAKLEGVKDGEPGAKGEKGDPGEKGDRGADGAAGADGQKGDKGDQGDRGEKGDAGDRGEQGEPGTPGADGRQGDQGEKGIQGDAGRDGRDGRDGAPGEDGRDALEIEILAGIDENRRYRRGTYAAHDNGIWRSAEPTNGMEGWVCLIEGLKDLEVVQGDDLRTFTVRQVMSSGRAIDKSFTLPVLIDRGVWRAAEGYAKGDAVTWDGSVWIAQQDSTGMKPDTAGAETAWRLAVKRGRDGRNGAKGDTGFRGAEGRPGRDLTQMGLNGEKW